VKRWKLSLALGIGSWLATRHWRLVAAAQASVGSVGRFTDPYENIFIDTCDSGYTPYTDGFLGLVVGGSLDWFLGKPKSEWVLGGDSWE
jgi:hypothetical protein